MDSQEFGSFCHLGGYRADDGAWMYGVKEVCLDDHDRSDFTRFGADAGIQIRQIKMKFSDLHLGQVVFKLLKFLKNPQRIRAHGA